MDADKLDSMYWFGTYCEKINANLDFRKWGQDFIRKCPHQFDVELWNNTMCFTFYSNFGHIEFAFNLEKFEPKVRVEKRIDGKIDTWIQLIDLYGNVTKGSLKNMEGIILGEVERFFQHSKTQWVKETLWELKT